MRFGSLFAGIGGLDLGLERVGMQCRWQVEIDEWCRRVLAKHWPDVPRYADIRDVGDGLASVDLICGGFPCQPFSLAGRRRGTADERWMWPEFERVVRLLRPRYVLLENVAGLLTADDGRAMGEILGDLAALGYDSEWECIPAAAVGAPHLRWRVFIVAYTESSGSRALGATSNGTLADRTGRGSQPLVNTKGVGRRGGSRIFSGLGTSQRGWWSSEPDVGRVAHGVPARVDRLRGLGNAVVPQVAEAVGRMILEYAT